jgi:hypothetical protein
MQSMYFAIIDIVKRRSKEMPAFCGEIKTVNHSLDCSYSLMQRQMRIIKNCVTDECINCGSHLKLITELIAQYAFEKKYFVQVGVLNTIISHLNIESVEFLFDLCVFYDYDDLYQIYVRIWTGANEIKNTDLCGVDVEAVTLIFKYIEEKYFIPSTNSISGSDDANSISESDDANSISESDDIISISQSDSISGSDDADSISYSAFQETLIRELHITIMLQVEY